MPGQVVVVRSKTEQDAVVRLQSDAVLRGLNQISDIATQTVPPNSPEAMIEVVQSGACVLFHYDDVPARRATRLLRASGAKMTVGCFGSDIYSFTEYLEVHDVTDFYLVPTPLHRRILLSQVYKPVYRLPESVDPTVFSAPTPPGTFPGKTSARLLWFGYPESFGKGMASLVPILKYHEGRRTIDAFTLVVGLDSFDNQFGLHTIPYNRESFARDAASFDYCILSHMALDLAVNSYIKSPNKLITALALGLIPIASRTPSYEELLLEFGLSQFLFDSPAQLDDKLGNLDPVRDSSLIKASGILPALLSRYSDASVGAEFLKVIENFVQLPASPISDMTPGRLRQKTPELHIVEHLRDLVPSLFRLSK